MVKPGYWLLGIFHVAIRNAAIEINLLEVDAGLKLERERENAKQTFTMYSWDILSTLLIFQARMQQQMAICKIQNNLSVLYSTTIWQGKCLKEIHG